MKYALNFTLFFLLALTSFMPSIEAEQETPFPKVTLSAEATIHKEANELQMKLGVIDLGENAEEVLAANSEKMKAVIKSLEALGLSKDDYHTGRFSIHPTYTPYPKNPPLNWKPSINGYEVSNSIAIKTSDIPLAGKIIDAANKAGANSVENIHFTLKDPRAYWSEAMSAATTNAISDAQVLAQAAGVTLGRLISISLDKANSISPRSDNIYFAKAALQEAIPPIEAGTVSITASVSIVYEIAN